MLAGCLWLLRRSWMGREGQPRALRHSALPAGSCRPEPSSPGPPFGSCILLDSGNPSPPVLTNFCALSAGAQLPAPPVRASASWAPKPGGCAAEAVWVLSEHRKPGPAWLPCSSPGAACVIDLLFFGANFVEIQNKFNFSRLQNYNISGTPSLIKSFNKPENLELLSHSKPLLWWKQPTSHI